MKRVLLSTTALVAAGLLVTSVAYAADDEMMEEEMMAEPVSVSVGGYFRVAGGAHDADGAMNDRGHTINQNIEINLAGETTLDNGITAGVNIWLDGNIGFQEAQFVNRRHCDRIFPIRFGSQTYGSRAVSGLVLARR